jgi:hypothetical protein
VSRLQFRCKSCGSSKGYSSRTRNFMERYLMPLLLLRPARCGDCFRRSYVLKFVSLLHPEPTSERRSSARA